MKVGCPTTLLLSGCLLSIRHGIRADDAPTQSCPGALDMRKDIDSAATLHYAVVPSSPSGSGNGILCARLEVEHDGWVGFGISESGQMAGSQGIVGVPGDDPCCGSVLKYNMFAYGVNPMPESQQTLRDTGIVQQDGKTIMTFTKLLVEDDEIPIEVDGGNEFLYARGGRTLGHHITRSTFELTPDSPPASDQQAGALQVGDEVCVTNYIMDQYCLNLGHFLDNSSAITLQSPELHSFHCLLDVPLCRNSGYVVLTDKNAETGMHCIGYRLDDTDAVVEAGSAAGQKGYCSICTGDESKPEYGFRATVKGVVKELGDGSSGITGAPILENITVVDESVEKCSTAAADPVCMAPEVSGTPEATPATDPEPLPAKVDCSKQFCTQVLDEAYKMRYKINVPADTTEKMCNGCTISMEVTYEGEAWVSIGFSKTGQMVGSEAVM
ncbi:hypothetical protein ACHAWF_005918 [Thalassiosira exigua]